MTFAIQHNIRRIIPKLILGSSLVGITVTITTLNITNWHRIRKSEHVSRHFVIYTCLHTDLMMSKTNYSGLYLYYGIRHSFAHWRTTLNKMVSTFTGRLGRNMAKI